MIRLVLIDDLLGVFDSIIPFLLLDQVTHLLQQNFSARHAGNGRVRSAAEIIRVTAPTEDSPCSNGGDWVPNERRAEWSVKSSSHFGMEVEAQSIASHNSDTARKLGQGRLCVRRRDIFGCARQDLQAVMQPHGKASAWRLRYPVSG